MNFYISDLHFGHKNILRYDNRPFSTLLKMEEELIKRWNSVVTDSDTVYLLGDISWYNDATTFAILTKLKGHKILIKGNHDHFKKSVLNHFDQVLERAMIFDNGTYVVLDHFPQMFWDRQFYGSVHLYGHVHNSHQWNMMESWMKEARELQALPMEGINVGCMMPYMDYTPKTLEQIRSEYAKFLTRN